MNRNELQTNEQITNRKGGCGYFTFEGLSSPNKSEHKGRTRCRTPWIISQLFTELYHEILKNGGTRCRARSKVSQVFCCGGTSTTPNPSHTIVSSHLVCVTHTSVVRQ